MNTERASLGADVPRFCPVGCGRPLEEGDRLYAEWYAPRAWWVLYHVKAENVPAFEASAASRDEMLGEHSHCACADLPLPEDATVIRGDFDE